MTIRNFGLPSLFVTMQVCNRPHTRVQMPIEGYTVKGLLAHPETVFESWYRNNAKEKGIDNIDTLIDAFGLEMVSVEFGLQSHDFSNDRWRDVPYAYTELWGTNEGDCRTILVETRAGYPEVCNIFEYNPKTVEDDFPPFIEDQVQQFLHMDDNFVLTVAGDSFSR